MGWRKMKRIKFVDGVSNEKVLTRVERSKTLLDTAMKAKEKLVERIMRGREY